MPIHPVEGGGYRYGAKGTVYRTRAGAERQAAAIAAAGWNEDAKIRKAVVALRPNSAAEVLYTATLGRIMGAVFKGILDVVKREHLGPKALRQDGDPPPVGLSDKLLHKIIKFQKPRVQSAFDAMATTIAAHAKKQTSLLGINPHAVAGIDSVIDHAREANVALVTKASSEMLERIRQTLEDSEGDRPEEIAEKLAPIEGIGKRRAFLIARDQVGKLQSTIVQHRARAAGLNRYRWSGALDERERPMHRELEGRVFSWDDPPVTNEDDDRNHPGFDFACRCVALPFIEELENEPEEGEEEPEADEPDEAGASEGDEEEPSGEDDEGPLDILDDAADGPADILQDAFSPDQPRGPDGKWGGGGEPQVIRPEGWGSANDEPDSWKRAGHVYRGMTSEEFAAHEKTGSIQSTGAYSHSSEGTNFTDDPLEAESYINFGRDDPRATGKPTYLVEVKHDPAQIPKDPRDGYFKAPAPVPLSAVTRVWKMTARTGPTGEALLSRAAGRMSVAPGEVVATPHAFADGHPPHDILSEDFDPEQPRDEGGRFGSGGGAPKMMLKDRVALDRAHDALWAPLQGWIHSPSAGKGPLAEAYSGLDDHAKAMLDRDVSAAFEREHGGDEVTAYRYKDRHESAGGMSSLTTEKPAYLSPDKYSAYRVRSSDVLAHYGQSDLPLGGKAFGHEKELVLKPGAAPARMDAGDFDEEKHPRGPDGRFGEGGGGAGSAEPKGLDETHFAHVETAATHRAEIQADIKALNGDLETEEISPANYSVSKKGLDDNLAAFAKDAKFTPAEIVGGMQHPGVAAWMRDPAHQPDLNIVRSFSRDAVNGEYRAPSPPDEMRGRVSVAANAYDDVTPGDAKPPGQAWGAVDVVRGYYKSGAPLRPSDLERVQQNFTHELGHHIHQWDRGQRSDEFYAADAAIVKAFKENGLDKTGGRILRRDPDDFVPNPAISLYSATSAKEYFAEAFSAYVHTEAALKAHDPIGHAMVEKVLGLRGIALAARGIVDR